MINKDKLVIMFFVLFSTFKIFGQNNFPAELQTEKTDQHSLIAGSRVYCKIPPKFIFFKESLDYRLNENLSFQILEINSSNFKEYSQYFTKKSLEERGLKIDVVKNIKLNSYDAIYLEGPSKKQGETKLILLFGDESFVVIVGGIFKTEDINGRNTLQNIFKSIYYDKFLQLDPLEFARFDFDLTITNFKYTMTSPNLRVATMIKFTENGQSDAQNPTSNSLHFKVLFEFNEFNAEEYLESIISSYEKTGIKFYKKIFSKTKINNQIAYILETKIEYQGKVGIMYQAVILFEKNPILFVASSYNDVENYLTKFKKTTETIKLK